VRSGVAWIIAAAALALLLLYAGASIRVLLFGVCGIAP
jgi:hypothetical protein